MWRGIRIAAVGGAMSALFSLTVLAQEPAVPASNTDAPVALTLKRAIELALQNSKDIQVAKIQASVADRAAQITKAEFMPNLYAGSGARHRSST
jgi:outer membrane protein TolC